MDRRHFLKTSISVPLVAYLPIANAKGLTQGNLNESKKSLVLIQLGGGNDSLNTFIPYHDEAYYQARPNIAVANTDLIVLNDHIALHPSLDSLKSFWLAGDMALVHGLGYPSPNRSHFRSIEIWQTASSSQDYLSTGWLSDLINDPEQPLSALTISGSPMSTHGLNEQFNLAGQTSISKFKSVYVPEQPTSDPLLQYVVAGREQFNQSYSTINMLLEQDVSFDVEFPNTELGEQCYMLAKLMSLGFIPKVWHLGLGSFDTHNNQVNQHSALLKDLADSLTALSLALKEVGLWNNTTIASYCEFGRRVSENGSNGTDHGTAATHFVLGGNINGGEYGEMPSLTDLDNGDLKYNQDFRSYYKSLSVASGLRVNELINDFDSIGFELE